MALYSDNYLYHNLTKADIRKIWDQLFKHYKELESFHSFSVDSAGRTGRCGSNMYRRLMGNIERVDVTHSSGQLV